MRIAKVALPVPLPHSLSYVVPEELASVCVRGARVVCPLGARRELGVVLINATPDNESPDAARYLAGNPRAKLSGLARHVLGLFTGQPGAREFRRLLTGPTSESPVAVMARAVAAVQRAQSARAS